jgi:hypothetical protein
MEQATNYFLLLHLPVVHVKFYTEILMLLSHHSHNSQQASPTTTLLYSLRVVETDHVRCQAITTVFLYQIKNDIEIHPFQVPSIRICIVDTYL